MPSIEKRNAVGASEYAGTMSETMVNDRRATWSEVAARRAGLHTKAESCSLTDPRLRGDGAVIVHAPDSGYRLTGRFAAEAAKVVGTYVGVLTDGVPAVETDVPPLGRWGCR